MNKSEDVYLKKIEELNKKFGKGTIIDGSAYRDNLEVINSGSLTLNVATGINGIPIGKLIEMFGPESSGKSTLTLHFIAEFQKAGKRCGLVDFEQSFDKEYAKALGVQVDDLLIVQPDCMEDGYNIIQELVKTNGFGLLVIDSHTAMVPRKILEGEIGDPKMAIQARLNSEGLLKIKPLLARHACTLIGVSQLRTQIGSYGDPDRPSGGNAWKFYSDMRFKVAKKVEKTDKLNSTTVEIIKNKCAPPFGKAEFDINWGTGIDRMQEIITLSVDLELIKKGGAWYTLKDDVKLQGEEMVKAFLRDNPEYALELETFVLNKIKEAA